MKIHNDNLSVTPDQLMLQKLLIASMNGTTIKKLVVQSIQQRSVKPAQSAPVPVPVPVPAALSARAQSSARFIARAARARAARAAAQDKGKFLSLLEETPTPPKLE